MDPINDNSLDPVTSEHLSEFETLCKATDNTIIDLNIINSAYGFEDLLKVTSRQIKCINEYKISYANNTDQMVVSLEKMVVNSNGHYFENRDIAVMRAKFKTINGLLKVLTGLEPFMELFDNHLSTVYKIMPHCDNLSRVLTFKLKELLHEFKDEMVGLHSGLKSPYNFKLIFENLSRDIEKNPNTEIKKHVASLIDLVVNEIVTIRDAEGTNEMQRKLLSIHFDKIARLRDEFESSPIPSLNATIGQKKKSAKEKKQIISRLKDTSQKCYKIIRDVIELKELFETVDWINESESIFEIINEKQESSFDDVYRYIENIKSEWLTEEIFNETRKVCKNAFLRRINVIIKQMKKISLIKGQMEPSMVVCALKKLVDNLNQLREFMNYLKICSNWLTYQMLPKRPINVPEGFVRDDPIYGEIHADPSNCLLINYKHIVEYISFFNSLEWNRFQERKPRKLRSYLDEICGVIHASIRASLEDKESFEISLDLADRYSMTKKKVAYDRAALEFRLFLYKPKKVYHFTKFYQIIGINRFYMYSLYKLFESEFDTIVSGLRLKIKNRGQLIFVEKAMAMMKRSSHCLNLMRCPDDDTTKLLVGQAVNEYCYAAEIVVELLQKFRSNRRIPYSFSAHGHFIEKVNSLGLKVKDDFIKEVDSQIKLLKKTIREKETDLQPVKSEKTQLRYLTSIYNRSKLIPINELELTEQDEVEIFKEIVEEYEYTMMTYGPVH